MTTIGTINEAGVNVDLYIPRKCHASNTLIPAYDFASIQLNIGDIDATGAYTGTAKTLCIAGFLRNEAESDHAINRLCITHGIIRARTGKPKKQKKRLPVRAPVKKAAAPGQRRAAPRPAGKGARTGDRKPRVEGDKPRGPRGPRPEGERKPRTEGDRAPRGPRPEGERKPRTEGDRAPRGPRPEGERKPRTEGDRAPRGPRPEGERAPRGPRPEGARPPRKPAAKPAAQ